MKPDQFIMTVESQLLIPAFNLNKNVRNFMVLGERTLNHFSAEQAAQHTGFQLEELAEQVAAIMEGCLTPSSRQELGMVVAAMKAAAASFKAGHHDGDVLRGDRVEMLDGAIDSAWVALSTAYSISNNVDGACEEVARSNLAKFPNNICTKDARGKIMKPPGWTPPDLARFLDPIID